MVRITASVTGMACGMCEAHVNETIRNHFKVKKVTSSHVTATTVIESETPIDAEELKKVIDETGYTCGEVTVEEIEKKKFSLFGKK